MLQWLRRRAEVARKADELYGRVVAAARQPAFYADFGVSDTPEGRFELVLLHLFLALEAIKDRGREATAIAQRTIETFVVDMDDCMREMGVGDLTVPKKVKKAAAAFYARAARYRQAIAEDGAHGPSTALCSVIRQVAPSTVAQPEMLADYIRRASLSLKTTPLDDIFSEAQIAQLHEPAVASHD